MLPKGGPEPGPWSTARAEYLREFMDVFSDPAVEDVVGVFASQTGKSEALLNVCGYHVDVDPAEMLFVQATLPAARSFSKKRVAPMLREILGRKFPHYQPGAKKSGEEILEKEFPGGGLALAGANSPAGLASRPARIVLGDEVDRWPLSAGSEGDPMEIAKARTSNFKGSFKRGWISSPGVKGLSRIWPAWEESDQRLFYVDCLHCGVEQLLEWEHVRFDSEDADTAATTAVYRCPHCEKDLDESDRDEMVSRGRWRATYPMRRIPGFRLSALYSPWQTFGDLAAQWIRAQGFPERLKAFVTTRLAELWDELGGGELPSAEQLLERREAYGPAVPRGVLVITAGVDVQDDRLEVEILGTGRNGETWSLEFHRIYGDPVELLDVESDDDRLDELLAQSFTREDGAPMKIAAACIDSGGHHTDEVYRFCARRRARRIYAIKGQAGDGVPLWNPRAKQSSKARKAGGVYFRVGVDTGKRSVLHRLKRAKPGPGYCHFRESDDFDLEYFKQLEGEAWVEEYARGRKTAGFRQVYPRVEALDCRVYAMAAVDSLRPKWKALEKNRAEAAARARARGDVDLEDDQAEQDLAPPEPDPPRRGKESRPRAGRPRRGRRGRGFLRRY